jgi:hypothetical protein
MLPNMRDVAAALAKDASDQLAGIEVISIGPLYAHPAVLGGVQFSVVVIAQSD